MDVQARIDAAAQALLKGGADLAPVLLKEGQEELRESWDALADDVRSGISWAAVAKAKLIRKRLAGEDTTREDQHVRAIVANWTWVGSDRLVIRWQAFLEQVAKRAGELVQIAIKAAL